jgi:hypothetical protein
MLKRVKFYFHAGSIHAKRPLSGTIGFFDLVYSWMPNNTDTLHSLYSAVPLAVHKPLINRAEVRRRHLQLAADTRHHKFTRVSKSTLDDIEATVDAMIRRNVRSAPSRGVTL